MIRSIRPTDLPALIRFYRASTSSGVRHGGESAQPGRPHLPITAFLDEWLSLDENRHTWMDVHQRQVRAILSVTHGRSKHTWWVDRFVVAEGGLGDVDLCRDLLEYVSLVGAKVGIRRVFLQLPSE